MKSRLGEITRGRAWKALTGTVLVFGLLLYAQSWLVPIEGLHVPSPRKLCAAELPAPLAQSSCPVGSLEHFANSWTQSFGTAFTQSQSGSLTANRVVTWPDASGTVGYLELAQLWPANQTFTALTATTADINGGTVDGVTVGGVTPGAGTFTTLNATGGGALTGTWSNLGSVTTIDINGGTIDGATIGGSNQAAGSFTTITTSSFADLQNNELRNIGNAGSDITASAATFAQDLIGDNNVGVGEPVVSAGLVGGLEMGLSTITGPVANNRTVIRSQRTTGITTTTPATIFTSGADTGCFGLVKGRQLSTADEFTDLVLFAETTSFDVSNGNNDVGSPEARTYAMSGNSLQITFLSAPAAQWRIIVSSTCIGDTL